MQKMTERPPSIAALTLRAMNFGSSVSWSDSMSGSFFDKRDLARFIDCGATYIVGLFQNHTALAVANDNPVDLGILELLDTDLTSEGTIGLVENVLGSDADLGVGKATGEGEVQGGRGDDDLGVGVEISGVEVLHDVGDGLSNTVPGLFGQLRFLEELITLDGGARLRPARLGRGDVHLKVTSDEELARHFGCIMDMGNE